MNDNSATAKELSLAIKGYGLLAAVSVFVCSTEWFIT